MKNNYKLSNLIDEDELVSNHVARWDSSKGDLLSKCRHIAKKYLSTDSPEEAIGDLPVNLELSALENKIIKIIKSTDRKSIILMDRLDEGYEPDPIGIGIITGLVYASIELNKKTDKIRPVIFLRDNIYRAVAIEDPDYSRNIEGQVMRLHWDWHQLLTSQQLECVSHLELIKRRINVFGTGAQRENSRGAMDLKNACNLLFIGRAIYFHY